MSRQTTRACYISIRNFTQIHFLPISTTTPEANNILQQVRQRSNRGLLTEALSLFYNAPPLLRSQQTYAILFHACTLHGNLQQGLHLHQHMVSHYGLHPFDLFVTNHLINMYCKFGYLDYAQRLFDEMPKRNLVSWTALISGYAQHGHHTKSFRMFSGMLLHFRPNEFAFASVLSSCGYVGGKQVHALAVKMCLDAYEFVANSLVNMYSKNCGFGGSVEEAWKVFENMEFRNVVSWNSMIAGFHYCNSGEQAIKLFVNMRHEEIEVTTALVKAYSGLGGDIAECYRLFLERRCSWDIVSWTGIITAVAESEPEEALFLFCQLCREGLTPDCLTFSIVLKACAGLLTDRHAMTVHSQVVKAGFEGDIVLANALIHAYARCGSIVLSKQVFKEMEFRDLVSWNSMLKAYALHGKAKEALQLFSTMNVQPDSATFVALLTACSHTGLVEEGNEVFNSMADKHGVTPQLDHYACMVDILGRAGRILEAEKLINKMPMEPDSVVWSALLGSCRKHGVTHLAELAAAKLQELEPGDSLGYVQMSNVYCSSGSFSKAGLIRKTMKGYKVRKEPGLSWVEIENQVHEFASGGKRHPQRNAICTKLSELIGQLKEMGYVPETSLTLHDIEEEHKEEQLYHHSEKLALVFAIMNQETMRSEGSAIKIMKNIRICVDCHNFMKLASDLLQKEIVVRDSNRFHHFRDRKCSCNDYW
ncbi:pentatricopeptide repeat-containing protein At1g71420 isoform X2 [Mangifera indica]|uniref:pentatricopeptide repeat-containing protein At1g71420 isoform X2 n=1 Tax=Mangifera indica TaxID=29780 RepID=UPI001CFAC16E|nr:pentatricopeptide repeat-containing protein At1g71420 isoform X2 [Mangifera indica]